MVLAALAGWLIVRARISEHMVDLKASAAAAQMPDDDD
jgi:hypothetical protein